MGRGAVRGEADPRPHRDLEAAGSNLYFVPGDQLRAHWQQAWMPVGRLESARELGEGLRRLASGAAWSALRAPRVGGRERPC